MAEANDELVRYEVKGKIALLTLNRPPVNALSMPLWQALGRAAARLSADESAHVGILTAEGRRVFCAGADVRDFLDLTPETRRERHRRVSEIMMGLFETAVPLICAINGPAVGAGMGMTGLCDYRIAADHAHFSMPEIERGTVGGGGAHFRRLNPPLGVLHELLYSGRRFSAQECLEAHLVDRVVPYEELMPAAMNLAESFASKARPALVLMKKGLLETEKHHYWADGYVATHPLSAEMTALPESLEGQKAFLEKRDPHYDR